MWQGFSHVLVSQIADKVHQVHRHVVLTDAATHAQLVKPRLLLEHLFLQLLQRRHLDLGHQDSVFIPFSLMRARALGGS